MYLLDTNICIYAINGRHLSINQKLFAIHPNLISVSAITVGELEYGAAKSHWGQRTREVMNAFLANFTVLPFTEEDARLFGKIRAGLEASGTPIGLYDAMIGTQGVARGMTVVTHNTREFIRIPGIVLEDWAEGH